MQGQESLTRELMARPGEWKVQRKDNPGLVVKKTDCGLTRALGTSEVAREETDICNNHSTSKHYEVMPQTMVKSFDIKRKIMSGEKNSRGEF